jgi:hypothetical protein
MDEEVNYFEIIPRDIIGEIFKWIWDLRPILTTVCRYFHTFFDSKEKIMDLAASNPKIKTFIDALYIEEKIDNVIKQKRAKNSEYKYGMEDKSFWNVIVCLNRIFILEKKLSNISDDILHLFDIDKIRKELFLDTKKSIHYIERRDKNQYLLIDIFIPKSTEKPFLGSYIYFELLPVIFGCMKIWKILSKFYDSCLCFSTIILFPGCQEIIKFNQNISISSIFTLYGLFCILTKLHEKNIDIRTSLYIPIIKEYLKNARKEKREDIIFHQNGTIELIKFCTEKDENYIISKNILDLCGIS